MHAKLFADDVPDVLFLDGLSFETLNNKGFLSDIDIELDRTQNYDKIINSYCEGGKIYAYPVSFSIPVFVHDGSLSNITQLNTIERIAELYSDTSIIEGFADEWSVFETYFYPCYHNIFPNYKTIDVENLRIF